jgi:hypothetical protein
MHAVVVEHDTAANAVIGAAPMGSIDFCRVQALPFHASVRALSAAELYKVPAAMQLLTVAHPTADREL